MDCPATAQAVLVEHATNTDHAKYVCSGVSHNHNHEVDEVEELLKASKDMIP